jgi:PleD family two-component response regulator
MKRLLIVEDDYQFSFELKQVLQQEYEIDDVVDGMSALAKVHATPYEVVLLDLEVLGEVDGMQILKAIKGDKETEKTIVVILTNAGPGRKEECMAQGANLYLEKGEISLQGIKQHIDQLVLSSPVER